MLKVSCYVKDLDYNPSSYYRILQFMKKLEDKYQLFYHPQIMKGEYEKFMPLNNQSFLIKVFFELLILFRINKALKFDLKNNIDVLIVSRRFINRFMPLGYKNILLKMKKRGTKIIWDFDDQILISKEVNKKGFDFLSKISDKIVVTHNYLQQLVNKNFQNKVELMPTTDGDIYEKINEEIQNKRIKYLSDSIRLIWIGTKGNLKYVLPIINTLDSVAIKTEKKIIFTVVSDGHIQQDVKKLIIRNVEWSRESAVNEVLSSHIGLMPLKDSDFAKGKGGFKLVQYLSAALPIIGSDVGFNSVVCDSSVGVLLKDFTKEKELKTAIEYCTKENEDWINLSQNAYNRWNKLFSFSDNLQKWQNFIEL